MRDERLGGRVIVVDSRGRLLADSAGSGLRSDVLRQPAGDRRRPSRRAHAGRAPQRFAGREPAVHGRARGERRPAHRGGACHPEREGGRRRGPQRRDRAGGRRRAGAGARARSGLAAGGLARAPPAWVGGNRARGGRRRSRRPRARGGLFRAARGGRGLQRDDRAPGARAARPTGVRRERLASAAHAADGPAAAPRGRRAQEPRPRGGARPACGGARDRAAGSPAHGAPDARARARASRAAAGFRRADRPRGRRALVRPGRAIRAPAACRRRRRARGRGDRRRPRGDPRQPRGERTALLAPRDHGLRSSGARRATRRCWPCWTRVPGIAPEERERVFERFFRGEASRGGTAGTGLGLSVVEALARRWDGAVALIPRAVGTRAELRLPLSPGASEPNPDRQLHDALPGPG